MAATICSAAAIGVCSRLPPSMTGNLSIEIASGNLSVVNDIKVLNAERAKRGTVNYYSFASKYCCQHNPEAFPIYDRRVREMLMYFQKLGELDTFAVEELKDYVRFVDVMKCFRERFGLEQVPWRWIDRLLWFMGTDAKKTKR